MQQREISPMPQQSQLPIRTQQAIQAREEQAIQGIMFVFVPTRKSAQAPSIQTGTAVLSLL